MGFLTKNNESRWYDYDWLSPFYRPVPSLSSVVFSAESFTQFATNLTENDSKYTLTAEVPGAKEEDVTITFENECLTISYERDEQRSSKEDDKYVWQEQTVGRASRSFTFKNVNPDSINAELSQGVLTVTLEKQNHVPPAKKQIEINSK